MNTDFEDFDPANDLLEYNITSLLPFQGEGHFIVRSLFYTADSNIQVGNVWVKYIVESSQISSSNLRVFSETGGSCYDVDVLDNQLDKVVSWRLTTENLATVDSTTSADFASHQNYEEFVNLIASVNITRIKTQLFVSGDVTGDEAMVDYRILKS